jgi:hypothetical protein
MKRRNKNELVRAEAVIAVATARSCTHCGEDSVGAVLSTTFGTDTDAGSTGGS